MTSPRSLLLLGSIAFFHVGSLQAIYGPSFAALQVRFDVGVAEVGASVAAHFFGAFLGVLLPNLVLARSGYRPLMVAAGLLMAIGAAGVPLAPEWSVVLVAAGVGGLGYGLSVVLYNLLLARVYGSRGAMAVNVINGAFGVGAVAAPAFVALLAGAFGVGATSLSAAFATSAAVALLVSVLAARTPAVPAPLIAAGSAATRRFPLAATVLFSAIFFVYVAVEVGTASWAPTHLAERLTPARAALATSAFWVAMTIGRFAAAIVATRIRPGALVVASSSLGLLGLLLSSVAPLALVGYAVAGLALGPVFPTSVAWLHARFGALAERIGPVAIASGNLGPVLGAPAVGLAVAAFGVAAIPGVLAAVVAALLVLAIAAVATTPAQRPSEG